MGRKIEFNLEQALDRAMMEFWKSGYSNTSTRDLLKVMEIGESSFYHLFGSKKDLYLKCLKRYNEQISAKRIETLLGAPSAAKGVKAFFAMIMDDLDKPKFPQLCLMAGSLSRDVLDETELQKYVVEQTRGFEEIFFNKFELDKQAGNLPSTFNSRVSAQIFVTYLQGFFRVIKTIKSRDEMEQQVNALMAGLGIALV